MIFLLGPKWCLLPSKEDKPTLSYMGARGLSHFVEFTISILVTLSTVISPLVSFSIFWGWGGPFNQCFRASLPFSHFQFPTWLEWLVRRNWKFFPCWKWNLIWCAWRCKGTLYTHVLIHNYFNLFLISGIIVTYIIWFNNLLVYPYHII